MSISPTQTRISRKFFFFFFFFFPSSTDDCPRKTCSRVRYIIRKDIFPHFFTMAHHILSPLPHTFSPVPNPCLFLVISFIFFYYYATLLEWASLPNIVRTATLTVFFSLPYYTHTCIILEKKKLKKNLIPNFCCNQCHVTMFSTQ